MGSDILLTALGLLSVMLLLAWWALLRLDGTVTDLRQRTSNLEAQLYHHKRNQAGAVAAARLEERVEVYQRIAEENRRRRGE